MIPALARSRTGLVRLLQLFLPLAASTVVSAHHSILAVYDPNQPVTIDATVTQFRFVNPHPYLVVEVSEAGRVQPWHLEMDNRGELAAVGVTAETFRAGDRIVVTGSRSRTERRSLYVRRLLRSSDGLEYEQVGSRPRIKTP